MNATEKILLVDDSEYCRLAVEQALAPLGVEVVATSSGEEALKAALQQEFALVLLDVVMPGGMDGLQTAAYLKRLEQTKRIPLLFMSNLAGDVDCTAAGYTAGAADYLSKPIDPWALRAKVRALADLYLENQRLQAEVAQLNEEASALRLRYDQLTARLNEAAV